MLLYNNITHRFVTKGLLLCYIEISTDLKKKSQKNKFPPSQKSTKMWVQAVCGHYIYKRRKPTLLNTQQAFQRTFTQFTPESHLWKFNSLLSRFRLKIKGDLRVSQLPKQREKSEMFKVQVLSGKQLLWFYCFSQKHCDDVKWTRWWIRVKSVKNKRASGSYETSASLQRVGRQNNPDVSAAFWLWTVSAGVWSWNKMSCVSTSASCR